MVTAVFPAAFYLDSVNYAAVTPWPVNTAVSAGTLIRQNAAPTVGNERVFVCIVAGTTTNGAEPTWVVTSGSKTTDNTVTWMEATGLPGLNGDTVNTPTWLQNKNVPVPLGLLIFDSVTSSLQICTTAGGTGNGAQPSFSATAGVTTADNVAVWTSLGLASNFGKFVAPAARAQNAVNSTFSASGVNNFFYTASTHAEVYSAVSINITGSSQPAGGTAMNILVSVNKAGNVPPQQGDYQAGAAISVTFATGNLGLNANFRFEGFTLSAAVSVLPAGVQGAFVYLKNCKLVIATAGGAAGRLQCTNNAQTRVVLENTTVKFGNVGNQITSSNSSSIFEWFGNTASAIDGTGSLPTTLFGQVDALTAYVHGVDFSNISGTLWDTGGNVGSVFLFSNCKLNAGVTLTSGTVQMVPESEITLINCDSGATGYRHEKHVPWGDLTTETSITLRKGSTDYGNQSVSHKMVSTVNAGPLAPFIGLALTTECLFKSGNRTATVEIISSQTLNDSDIYLQLEYLGDPNSPLSTFITDGPANPLHTPVAQTSSSANWNASPPTPVTQKLTVNFTPGRAGTLIGRVYLAKPSTTVYIDPTLQVN